MTEFDWPDITIEGLSFLRIEPTIHKGNYSKSIISKNVQITVIPCDDIIRIITRIHKRTKYILDCINSSKDKYSIIKINEIPVLCLHLKSIGNIVQAKKNVDLYNTIKCIIDWLKEDYEEFYVTGDFNIPFLEEDKYIGFTKGDKQWHPLQIDPTEHCLNYEMIRISPTHTNSFIHKKIRTSDSTINSQANVGKFYEEGREGLTDHTFYYNKNKMYPEYTTELFPKDQLIKCLPHISDERSPSSNYFHRKVYCWNL